MDGTTSAQFPEVPLAPVPSSPYLHVVYRYADALLAHGRDRVGPVQSGLFLGALSRDDVGMLTNRPPAPTGVREGDRVGKIDGLLTGANPQHDQNLLRLLEVLSGLSGEDKYNNAAHQALRWFLGHTASPETFLLPWGEHMFWDAVLDRPGHPDGEPVHEFFRPWLMWDVCFDVAPEASARFARGLWDHQIADHASGAFDRHALFDRSAPGSRFDFPRHAGFYLRTWAVAYARTQDDAFLEAMDVVLRRFETKRAAGRGWIESSAGQTTVWPASNLSMGIDSHGASLRVAGTLADRLRSFAAEEDEQFVTLNHDLKRAGGFVVELRSENGEPPRVTLLSSLWDARYGNYTTAQVGMMCVARHDNAGSPAQRDLVMQAADAYGGKLPPEGSDVWPATLGQAISLQLAAWRYSAQARYLQHARALADWSLAHLWGESALPRASAKSDHYESMTGADTLALALTELHLQILGITAVRCPPNTLDR